MGEPGNYTFELGCDLFTRKGDGYLIMEKWWMIDSTDILGELEDPKIVKVTSNRCKYVFKDLP